MSMFNLTFLSLLVQLYISNTFLSDRERDRDGQKDKERRQTTVRETDRQNRKGEMVVLVNRWLEPLFLYKLDFREATKPTSSLNNYMYVLY